VDQGSERGGEGKEKKGRESFSDQENDRDNDSRPLFLSRCCDVPRDLAKCEGRFFTPRPFGFFEACRTGGSSAERCNVVEGTQVVR